ncbi:MAG TPA: hypothetical protein VM075_03960 [Anaerolineae bacterium]|nr:hypothetical protein [Anaerolineae bacterium]
MGAQVARTLVSKQVSGQHYTYEVEVRELGDARKYLAVRQSGGPLDAEEGPRGIMVLEEDMSAFARALYAAMECLECTAKRKTYSVKAIRQTYARAYTPWTVDDEAVLRSEYLQGRLLGELAAMLGRGPGAISARLKKMGLRPQTAFAVPDTSAREVSGTWDRGWVLDLHTLSSVPLPDGGFDTVYTEVGELLYRLKYKQDRGAVRPIAAAAVRFLAVRGVVSSFESIIPVPPSQLDRPFQPVAELALSIGHLLDKPVCLDYLRKVRHTPPLKGLDHGESRKALLAGAFSVADARFAGKPILLVDDLLRSGETLTEITHVLRTQGRVSRVYVLVITKTRTKK